MRKRRRYEPLTITHREVIDALEYEGYERMAAYVRMLAEDRRTVASVEREWREKYGELLKRLHVYEPPAPPHVSRCGKPGPMSDG